MSTTSQSILQLVAMCVQDSDYKIYRAPMDILEIQTQGHYYYAENSGNNTTTTIITNVHRYPWSIWCNSPSPLKNLRGMFIGLCLEEREVFIQNWINAICKFALEQNYIANIFWEGNLLFCQRVSQCIVHARASRISKSVAFMSTTLPPKTFFVYSCIKYSP